MISAFKYPQSPHVRKHGPFGYSDYESYCDWVRDEFTFRCVYCLHRETWGGMFHIDHLVPVSVDPSRECEYSNLLYSCARCNLSKSDIELPVDPCSSPFGQCLQLEESGEIVALNAIGVDLNRILRPNTPLRMDYRRKWIATLSALESSDPDLYRQWLSFPDSLPDLRTRRVKNTQPNSATDCYFALRERGELPATY